MIKPYYEREGITVYNCDCMDFMARYPDKYFELCIVDPPYGSDKIFNGSADYANNTSNTTTLNRQKNILIHFLKFH